MSHLQTGANAGTGVNVHTRDRSATGARREVRSLTTSDLGSVRDILDADPVTNAFVDARVTSFGLDPSRLGAEIWGYEEDGHLVSLCYVGANMVPVEATPAAVRAFAERARTRRGGCSSIWGPRDAVAPLWDLLEPAWGKARAVRSRQPFMVLDHAPRVGVDPLVRRVRAREFDMLYPASVAFFCEELGVSPEGPRGRGHYRSRVWDLLARDRAFARIEDGRVVFKADIGVETSRAFQIQGVWVPADRRGEGLAGPGTAAVVGAGFAEVAPVATLYVNEFNEAALRAYAAVGFEQRSTFMTVLF